MKNYVKPELHFESFELTQHIAGDCGVIMNMKNMQGECATGTFEFGETYDSLFEAQGVCEDYAEGYCYTSSSVMVGIFNS